MDSTPRRVGTRTLVCRALCSALVAAPWGYWTLVTEGSAYVFLVLVLLAPVAGLVLFVCSVFGLLRDRTWSHAGVAAFFIGVSGLGVLTARYFLPQFRM